jgi:hypothetical protein
MMMTYFKFEGSLAARQGCIPTFLVPGAGSKAGSESQGVIHESAFIPLRLRLKT